MCRNIRVLHYFEPPTTESEIEAAALQYVRKVSGRAKPNATEQEAFDAAVATIAKATRDLLGKLEKRGGPKTREGEKEKARAKWQARETRIVKSSLR